MVMISLISCSLFSQNGVDIWSNEELSSDPSSILSINAEDKGLLIPRMSALERSMITDPADGLLVYQTDSVAGFYYYSEDYWEKIQDEKERVPIGMVLEWWRPHANFPLPDGYVLCDGSLITDPESPFNGLTIPNLLDGFVKGVTDTSLIGTEETGIHSHNFDPPNVTLGSAGAHSHSLNFSVNLNYEGNHIHTIPEGEILTSSYGHRHRWSAFYLDDKIFPVPDEYEWYDGDFTYMMTWVDGMDSEGSDYFTLGVDADILGGGTQKNFYTEWDYHAHSLYGTVNSGGGHDHPNINVSPVVSNTGAHTHDLNIPSQVSDIIDDLSPPYYGLVKIIKIK